MSLAPFSREERRQLLDRYYQLGEDLRPPRNAQFTRPERQAKIAEQNALLQEYAERLPFRPLSRCPYCERVLEFPMDPEGFDGPWWFKDALVKYPLPNACPHFRVPLGAIDFKQSQSLAGQVVKEILPGPDVPFVVPRLLTEIEGMKAVISSFQLSQGYGCHLIAYYSPEPVDGALLHQPWARQDYDIVEEDSTVRGWFSANDQWDFDLQPWIDKGVLLWINPGDTTLTLQSRPPCPYVNLPGTRAPRRITRGMIAVLPLPSGKRLEPFE